MLLRQPCIVEWAVRGRWTAVAPVRGGDAGLDAMSKLWGRLIGGKIDIREAAAGEDGRCRRNRYTRR